MIVQQSATWFSNMKQVVKCMYNNRGVGTGGGWPPKFSKVPFFREQSALYLREKCRSDCIICTKAFDLWLHLFLYFGMSWKILLFSGKIMLCSKLFFIFRKEYVFSVKIFGVSGKFFSFSGKNVIYPGTFFEIIPPPPRGQHFRENFFRCPIHSKIAPQSLPPPTFRCFLRPCRSTIDAGNNVGKNY